MLFKLKSLNYRKFPHKVINVVYMLTNYILKSKVDLIGDFFFTTQPPKLYPTYPKCTLLPAADIFCGVIEG